MSIISLIQMICFVIVIIAAAVLAIGWIAECWYTIEKKTYSEEIEEWWS